MLEIHERLECGIPVIIEGETGVGKTALVEMLSVLSSHSLLGDLRLLQDRVVDLLNRSCHCELQRCKVYPCMYIHLNKSFLSLLEICKWS